MQQSQQLNKTERQCLSNENTYKGIKKIWRRKNAHTLTHAAGHANGIHAKTYKL